MANYIDDDVALTAVLKQGEEEDLAILADFITDAGKGRISLDNAVKSQLETFKRLKSLNSNVDLIAKEIQEFGGNTIFNIIRGTGVPYREILEDVAHHLGVERNDADDIEAIELRIILKLAIKAMEKMSPDEKRDFLREISGGEVTAVGPGTLLALQTAILAGGFASYVLAVTVANAIARQLLGRGISIAGNTVLTRGIGLFAGPIGWAITIIWAAFDLGSPAYRVTVPCVFQVAYMRQKMKAAQAPKCMKCGALISSSMKSCRECGEKVIVPNWTAA